MSDGDLLLKTVLACPDDDNVRLVYADWLQENGEDDVAAMIRWSVRTGCCYHRSPESGKWFREHHRDGPPPESVYVPLHGETGGYKFKDPPEVWRGLNHLLSESWPGAFTVVRGFVAEITCTAADWLACADALLARHPIRAVTLTTLPDLPVIAQRQMPLVSDVELAGRIVQVRESELPDESMPVRYRAACQIALAARWPGIEFTLPA